MRWFHIAAVALLVGGLLYGRQALAAISDSLASDSAETVADNVFSRFRPRVLAAIVLLLISGLYNYFFSTVHHSNTYLILFAIKILLVLHIFAAALGATRPHHPRRARVLAGAGLSGLIVIFLSNYLSRIS